MSWAYSYDPGIWPAVFSLALITFLGWYSWRRRSVAGARPFAVGCLFAALWAAGAALEISAVAFSDKVFWIKFQTVWQIPSATAIACFVLEYAGLGRWLTRRNLVLLAVLPLLTLVLIITNGYHHLVWSQFLLDGHVLEFNGGAGWFLIGYAYLLGLVNVLVLLLLAFRSPQHRWPVTIMLLGQVAGRGMYLLNDVQPDLLGPGETIFLVLGLMSTAYALALFRFRVFDPVHLARSAVIDQMSDGMLVLDLKGSVVDLNPAAANALARPLPDLRGRPITGVLPVDAGFLSQPGRAAAGHPEIGLGVGDAARHFSTNLTPLKDVHGQAIGYLLLLHEVTEQKRAQAQANEHQRVVATLRERERLARELHDGIGQVLGYVNVQAQAAQKLVLSGDIEKAGSLLGRLAKVAQDAHADVRESILSLKGGPGTGWAFVPSLRRYLIEFQTQYDIRTDLVLPNGANEDFLDSEVGVQLLRVIQEAMNNARKHANARTVRVSVKREGGRARITVVDDGVGFDPERANQETGGHFGLAFMRERMVQVGGSASIDSTPGAGTVVKLDAPTRNPQEATV